MTNIYSIHTAFTLDLMNVVRFQNVGRSWAPTTPLWACGASPWGGSRPSDSSLSRSSPNTIISVVIRKTVQFTVMCLVGLEFVFEVRANIFNASLYCLLVISLSDTAMIYHKTCDLSEIGFIMNFLSRVRLLSAFTFFTSLFIKGLLVLFMTILVSLFSFKKIKDEICGL